MQTTYQVTCKCGHIFPIPGKFLSTDEDERAALLKTLEGLPCADCIRADVEKTRAMREDLLGITVIPPDITEEGWRTLARDARRDILREDSFPNPPITPREHTILSWINRWNRYHPVGTEVFIIPPGNEQPPGLLGSRTTSPARMHHGRAMVDVEGHGLINLDRLIDMTTSNECMHYPEYSDASPWNAKVEYPIPKEAYAILHAIDAWNRDYPVGTEVYVNPTDAEKVSDPCTHRTNSPAKLLAGKPVVEVSGLGPIHIDRLVPFGG